MEEMMWIVNIDKWEKHLSEPNYVGFMPNEPVQVTVTLGKELIKNNWFFQEYKKDKVKETAIEPKEAVSEPKEEKKKNKKEKSTW